MGSALGASEDKDTAPRGVQTSLSFCPSFRTKTTNLSTQIRFSPPRTRHRPLCTAARRHVDQTSQPTASRGLSLPTATLAERPQMFTPLPRAPSTTVQCLMKSFRDSCKGSKRPRLSIDDHLPDSIAQSALYAELHLGTGVDSSGVCYLHPKQTEQFRTTREKKVQMSIITVENGLLSKKRAGTLCEGGQQLGTSLAAKKPAGGGKLESDLSGCEP